MPRKCPVCAHPQRAEIEQRFRLGTPIKALADMYGLPYHALYYHLRHHLSTGSTDEQKPDDASALTDMLRDMLYELYDQVMAVLRSGEKLNPGTIRELRGLARDVLELTGNLETGSGECEELKRFILEELPDLIDELPDDRRAHLMEVLGVSGE